MFGVLEGMAARISRAQGSVGATLTSILATALRTGSLAAIFCLLLAGTMGVGEIDDQAFLLSGLKIATVG